MTSSTVETALTRIERLGVKGATMLDLLAVSLSEIEEAVPMREQVALDWAKRLDNNRIFDLSPEELRRMSGMDAFQITRMQCLLEIGRRASLSNQATKASIDGFPDVEAYFADLREETQEHFCALYLTSKNGILARSTIHIGTVNMSVVGPREVFREGVRLGAASLVVVHNHPSGDPTPSPEDHQVTKKLAEVGKILDIVLLDHVIIGNPNSFSFRKKGLI